jgi:hypothetical protein
MIGEESIEATNLETVSVEAPILERDLSRLSRRLAAGREGRRAVGIESGRARRDAGRVPTQASGTAPG